MSVGRSTVQSMRDSSAGGLGGAPHGFAEQSSQDEVPQLNRFHTLVQAVAEGVERDYQEARASARRRDPQRAGHQAESTWKQVLEGWGNGWPVVSRRYIVGPWGESGEVDLVVLRPDYPRHLREEATILASGVAAAFSCKLTLRPRDIAEAFEQKQRIIYAGGGARGWGDELMRASFSFGLLAHSADLGGRSSSVAEDLPRRYQRIAHDSESALVKHPSEELDCLLVADSAFFSTSRFAEFPLDDGGGIKISPASTFLSHHSFDHPGAPLAQFVAWLSDLGADARGRGALASLNGMFGDESASGRARVWPEAALPQLGEDVVV
jgi:hypothetical protein